MTSTTKKHNVLSKIGLPVTESISDQPNLKGDWSNASLLLLLYTMQGLPLGFSQTVPIILQSNKNVSYKDQALFTFVTWPYFLKLLWAPLVDAFYVQKIGRRKSWLIPVQFLIGACFIYMANNIDELLPETGKPNVAKLVFVFFIAMFMVATQDIVVDGWALTMLKKKNVGYASTCNTTGLAIGGMIGSLCSSLFTSADFCNKYLRITPGTGGIVSLAGLLYFWGFLYMFVTTLIALLKKEKDRSIEDEHTKLNTLQNYVQLWKILKLPSIRTLAIALLTVRIGFAATDHVSSLKLIQSGVPKDDINMIITAMYVMKMITPLVIVKYTSGPKPMSVYLKAILMRLLWNIMFIMLIYLTPKLIKINGVVNIPKYYYVILVFVLTVQEVLFYAVFIALLAFFSQISDPRIGGTYMTLMNTLSNLGNAWTGYLALNLIDLLTVKKCFSYTEYNLNMTEKQNATKINEDDCVVTLDGYYVEMVVCTIIGIVWFSHFNSILKKLQTKCPSQWLANNINQPITKNSKNVFTISVT